MYCFRRFLAFLIHALIKKKNYGIVWLVDILFVFHMEGENVIKELVSLSSKVERSDHHRNSK